MRLTIAVEWRQSALPAGVSGLWMEQVIDRPYFREPAQGEWLNVGGGDDEYDLQVQQVSWLPDGCHLFLGAIREDRGQLLRSVRGAGFRERS
jgi:hypothetical protein